MPAPDRQRLWLTRDIGDDRAQKGCQITKGLERADDTFGNCPAALSLARVVHPHSIGAVLDLLRWEGGNG
jgi:hypothetical protein